MSLCICNCEEHLYSEPHTPDCICNRMAKALVNKVIEDAGGATSVPVRNKLSLFYSLQLHAKICRYVHVVFDLLVVIIFYVQ